MTVNCYLIRVHIKCGNQRGILEHVILEDIDALHYILAALSFNLLSIARP